jgi:hypothetical protein
MGNVTLQNFAPKQNNTQQKNNNKRKEGKERNLIIKKNA